MHILLTDILTCPRCGPAFGLILLADRVVERRVEEGLLGCSNCREKYAIRDYTCYFIDAESDRAEDWSGDVERLTALIGIAHGPATLLVGGPAAVHGARIAASLEGVEVIALTDGRGAVEGVSRIVAGASLPFASARVAGAGLSGSSADALLEEAARVVRAGARVVLEPAPADVAERLAAIGLRVAAHEADTAVAIR